MTGAVVHKRRHSWLVHRHGPPPPALLIVLAILKECTKTRREGRKGHHEVAQSLSSKVQLTYPSTTGSSVPMLALSGHAQSLLQWFLCFTIVVMLLLAFVGFTNVSHSLPLNDKFLHFTCFCIATAVFYFIFDVEECAFPISFQRRPNPQHVFLQGR